MPVYLLQEGSAKQQTVIAAGLRTAISGLTATASIDAFLKSVAKAEREEPAIALVILPPGDVAYFDRLVAVASRHHNEFFLIVIGDEVSASDYKRLVRTGGADWTAAKSSPSEVIDIIARRQTETGGGGAASTLAADGQPVTISFVPSAGGVGNATLALETAAYLKTEKSTRHRRICLVDLDFQTSHLCDYLDSEPRLQIAELSGAPERLDEHLFESFRTRHSSGIDIFASPRSKFPSEELNVHTLDALFSMIAKRYHFVIVDFPVTWFQWTAPIIAASDGAVITGINTIPCLRLVTETLATVRSSGSVTLQIGIAVNRCERTVLGAISRRKHVEMVLRDERLFFIASRPEAVEGVNMGVPMLLGASARRLRKEFATLGNFCSGLVASRYESA